MGEGRGTFARVDQVRWAFLGAGCPPASSAGGMGSPIYSTQITVCKRRESGSCDFLSINHSCERLSPLVVVVLPSLLTSGPKLCFPSAKH